MKSIATLPLAAILAMLIAASCSREQGNNQVFNESEAKKEVWEAVATRFSTWKDNDFDGHMAVYHPLFRRWSLDNTKLMTKEDFKGLWDQMKNNEQVIDMELEPVEIVFYDSGNMAIVHFLSTESFVWTGDAKTNDTGEIIQRGSVETVTMRWSDVMVKEDGKWLYVGGHRDYSGLPDPGDD